METLKENENYRVRIVSDDSGEKPYDEGSVPILSRDFSYYRGEFEAVNEQGKQYEDVVTEAWNRFNRDGDLLARFLRIFYGAYSVMEDSSQYNAYLAFDTAAWRESVGLTDEFLESGPDADTFDRSKIAEGSLKEIMAWANGEVYGYVLERRFQTVTRYIDPVSGVDVREVEASDVWEEIDSCYGFYGWDAVKEAAEEAFQRFE